MDVHGRLFGRRPEAADASRWAASGAMALTGAPAGPARLPPGRLVPAVTAIGDALGELTARLGSPVDVDWLAILGERAAVAGLQRQGRRTCGGGGQLLRAADGWVAVSLPRPDDADLLPAWLGGHGDLAARLTARPAAALVAGAAELGLAVSRLGEIGPGHESVTVTAGCTGPGRRTLAGVVVADLSSLWAGPLCGQLLTAAGARVIKVESSRRPDGARFGPPAFFDLLHAGQESVAFDLTEQRDRNLLRRLVARADVVIEASRPRALAQLGIDAGRLVTDRAVVWISITGYGRRNGQRVAFGDDAAVAGGLVAGDSSGGSELDPAAGPWFCADAVADPLSGLVAAAAALDRLGRGGGWFVDVSMAGVAAACAGPPMASGWTGAIASPRARPITGRAPALGADTDAVVRELITGGARGWG